MGRVEKVAVSLDKVLLKSAEELREKTGESRSALVARALRLLVANEVRQAKVEGYIKAYQEHPESSEEESAALTLAASTLKDLPW
ncbi:ribbon-helix-helix protein, CopG family [Myxococcota bacterium]|nr:ribbon-helix-helix protein, CopG family [Myxococcota bacterium]